MSKFPIVEVIWTDACASDNSWTPPDDLIEDNTVANCTTVGYLTKDTETEVQVIQSVCGSEGGEAMSIPRGCVTKVRRLNEVVSI